MLYVHRMAGFASQTTLRNIRTKCGDIVDSGSSTVSTETTEVSKGIKNVVGWLKQVTKNLLPNMFWWYIMFIHRCCHMFILGFM